MNMFFRSNVLEARMFKLAAAVAVVSLGLFGMTVQAQVVSIQKPVGIVKPFDPANPQPAPIAEAVVTGNGIEYHGGPVMAGPHQCLFHLVWKLDWQQRSHCAAGPDLRVQRFTVFQYQHNLWRHH